MSPSERRDTAMKTLLALAAELSPDRDLSSVAPGTHLEWDLGIGSLERFELTRRLEMALSAPIPAQAVFTARTVGDLLQVAEHPEAERTGPVAVVEPPSTLPPLPDHAQTLLEALLYQVEQQGDTALYHFEQPEASLSPRTLADEAGRMAGALAALGVRAGDRVGIMLPTGVAFVTSYFATLWLGAVPVPLYPPFRPDQAEDYVLRQVGILDNAGVEVLITFPRALTLTGLVKMRSRCLKRVVTAESLVGDAAPPVAPGRGEDLGLIQYTSGSTGLPKGVALTHANLLHNVRAYGKGLEVRAGDVCVSWLPLYHDMGLIGSMLGSIYHGIPLVLMGPQDFLARPSRWLWAIHRFRGSISPAPNFAYELCGRRIGDEELAGLDLSSWRVALNGAEPVRLETLARFTARFSPYGFKSEAHFPAFGLAEAALAVAFTPVGRGARVEEVSREGLEGERLARAPREGEQALQLVSSGRALEGTELQIRGDEVGERREGRLFFRSGSALQGYFGNPEATRAIKDADGWVDTGDLAFLSDGELYITGRAKDIIVKAGRNLHPQDVEEAAFGVEGVRRGCAAAFGVSAAGTERLVVVFETRQRGDEARALGRRVSEAIGRAVGVAPDECLPVGPGLLPKTPSGKIRRRECAQRYAAGTLQRKSSVAAQLLRLVRGTPVRGNLGAGLRLGWAVVGMLTLVGTPALLLGSRQLLRSGCRAWLRSVGLRLEVEGTPPRKGALLVSNHCSLLDVIVVMAACPTPPTFLVAPWIFDHPFLSRGVRRLGHLRATRGDSPGAARLSEAVKEALAGGANVSVFPEGGFETSPGLRQFSLGGFQVAAESGAAVTPLALVGTRTALPWPTFSPRPGTVRAVFGPPVRPSGGSFGAAVELARSTREWLAAQVGEPLVEQRLRREE